MSNYSPKGETVDLSPIVFELAVDRLVKRASLKIEERYQALLESNSIYQAFLAEAGRARANAEKYRQTTKTFGQKAETYAKRLDEGMGDGMDGTEITTALMEAQFYDGLAEAEEEKTLPPAELGTELRKMRDHAFNGVAGKLGYDIWGNVQTEAATVFGEIVVELYRLLDMEERKVAIENNRPYLDGVRTSAEELLRSLFGEHVYVTGPEVDHIDGRLDHVTTATIFTDAPEITIRGLQKEFETSEGVLSLVSAEQIPLNDGTGMSIVEAKYTGSKPLHD